MVKITNGINTFEVPNGAYESMFKKQGYVKVIADTEEEKENKKNDENKQKDEENELISKPISQWTKEEVKQFIEKKGIDVAGIRSFNEVKEKVKKFIEENA